jgi:predicted lipase
MDKSEALLCAVVAQAAYTNQCNEKNFVMTAKFENKGTDTQGFFGVYNGNTFVAAFRGSEETGTADWITDLKFLQDVFPYAKGDQSIKVHFGFNQAYKSVREAVIKAIQETPHKRVLLAGHSLGGALAKLCALDVAYNVPGKTVFCYTYGSPKVGNIAFAKAYDERVPNTFRIVNGTDMVPTIPPGDFMHVGQLFQIGGQKEDESSGWSWNELVDRVKDKLEEHFPHNYIKQLRL